MGVLWQIFQMPTQFYSPILFNFYSVFISGGKVGGLKLHFPASTAAGSDHVMQFHPMRCTWTMLAGTAEWEVVSLPFGLSLSYFLPPGTDTSASSETRLLACVRLKASL